MDVEAIANWNSTATVAIASLTLGGTWWAARKELAKWRTQKREDKRADVAGEVLGAAQRMLDALDHISSPRMSSDELPEAEPCSDDSQPFQLEDCDAIDLRPQSERDRIEFIKVLEGRWTSHAETSGAFRAAVNLARTYLPADRVALVEQVQQLAARIQHSQAMWLNPGIYGTHEAKALYEQSLGSKVHERIERLRREVLAGLRPLAQLEAT